MLVHQAVIYVTCQWFACKIVVITLEFVVVINFMIRRVLGFMRILTLVMLAFRLVTHLVLCFVDLIVEFSTEQGGLSAEVIRKAFKATEDEFLHLVKRTLPISPQIASVGSCCLLGAISDNVLYVANLGDSRAVLGRRDTESKKYPVVAERLSTDHNVAVEEVRREVEALHPDDSHVVVLSRGVWRIKGIIQVLLDSNFFPNF